MKKIILLLSFIMMIFTSCKSQKTNLNEFEKNFFYNLHSLCDNSYKGKETYIAPGKISIKDKEIIISFKSCNKNEIKMPIQINDDRSQTWILTSDKNGLKLTHDIKQSKITLYGGYADNNGTSYSQFFISDEYTKNLIGDNEERQWNIILNGDLTTMRYQMLFRNELIFEILFDIKNNIQK